MNPTLARIYGTGMSKTASAGLDLNEISAADYLNLANGEDDLDLSSLSDEELVELAESLDEDPIEKMASAGDLEYWDAAGRIMAHSYAQELEKVSSEDFISLDDISAAEAEELLASGEYELVDFEKTAGVKDRLMGLKRMAMRQVAEHKRGAGQVVGAMKGGYGLARKKGVRAAMANKYLQGQLRQGLRRVAPGAAAGTAGIIGAALAAREMKKRQGR